MPGEEPKSQPTPEPPSGDSSENLYSATPPKKAVPVNLEDASLYPDPLQLKKKQAALNDFKRAGCLECTSRLLRGRYCGTASTRSRRILSERLQNYKANQYIFQRGQAHAALSRVTIRKYRELTTTPRISKPVKSRLRLQYAILLSSRTWYERDQADTHANILYEERIRYVKLAEAIQRQFWPLSIHR